jgi:hypothetical protein
MEIINDLRMNEINLNIPDLGEGVCGIMAELLILENKKSDQF